MEVSEWRAESGSEMKVEFDTSVKVLYISMQTSVDCRCFLVARRVDLVNQERLKEWREIDRRDVFKEFERKHGNKFAFLLEDKQSDQRRVLGQMEELSPAQIDYWKKLFTEIKAKEDKKLVLFQKLRNIKKEDIPLIEDLDCKPFLKEILVVSNDKESS